MNVAKGDEEALNHLTGGAGASYAGAMLGVRGRMGDAT
jgi:hypothetical protein